MTTGATLYLVSACGSAEEFVAAFRRYADRTGLFVPSASPLPAGRRGRLAITLKDGGVMIEGEAEILQSSTKPTVLHGRPGMTVKFLEPDEPSKLVIAELEKARLALKPPPPSVPPRPATIPAEPRPVPPAPSGRIDAANALAECVVIGDVSALRETATIPRGLGGAVNDKSGSKFVVPAIPAIGAARPKTPSSAAAPTSAPAPAVSAPSPSTPTPTAAAPAAAAPAPAVSEPAPAAAAAPTPAEPAAASDKSAPTVTGKPPIGSSRMTSIGFPSIDKLPAKSESGRVVSNATTLGMPALDRKPESPERGDATPPRFVPVTTVPGPAPAPTSSPPAAVSSVNVHDETTTIGEAPVKKTTDPTIPATPIVEPVGEDEATAIGAAPAKKITNPMPTAVAVATGADASEARRSELAKNHKATSIGFPAMRTPFQTQPLGVVPPASPSALTEPPAEPAPPTLPKSGRAPAPGPRGKTPTTPPLTPRHPTPVAPVPIVRPPAKAAPAVAADEEKTDLASAPTVSAPIDIPAGEGDASKPVEQKAQRSGGMRASEILAAIPAGDWTMTPDESMPHPLPSEAKLQTPVVAEPTPAPAPPPKGPPTGDWTISLDPETGWSEPAKLDKPPAAGGPATTSGNPVVAVASEKPIDVVQWDEKPTSAGESKIEIDSALMAVSSPALDATASQTAIPDRGTADTPPPPPLASPSQLVQPAAARPVTPYPVSMAYGGTSVAASGQRKKMIAMAIGAAAIAVGAIVILVLTLSGGKQTSQAKASTTHDGSAMVAKPPVPADPPVAPAPQPPAPGSGSEQDAVEPAGSGSDTQPAVAVTPPPEPPQPAPSGSCTVEVTSVPSGADVYLDDKKLGTTPGRVELPCGTKSRLALRKAKYATTVRAFTPKADKPNKLVVKLARSPFSVKVTSTPAGATIKAGRRTMGVTPTTIKLPAYESSTLTLTKPGYAPSTTRVTPRQNNASHHVTLKKGRR